MELAAGSDIFSVAHNQTSAEQASSSIQGEASAFLSPPCRKGKVMAVPGKQRRKGYPRSQGPWAARSHLVGSPVPSRTALTAHGGASVPPRKLLGEVDLNREVKECEWLSKGNKRGKSLRPGSWRPRDCSGSSSCITAVKNRVERKFTQSRERHPVLLVMDSEMTSLLHCQMQNMNLIELWI